LGDNPLCLDSAEFRNHHMCILPLEFYIKSIIWIIESYSPIVCHHMLECLLCCLFENYLILLAEWCVKKLFYSSLPFLFDVCFLFGFPFCNDQQIISVSRCENPRQSSGWWECCSVACMGWILLCKASFGTRLPL